MVKAGVVTDQTISRFLHFVYTERIHSFYMANILILIGIIVIVLIGAGSYSFQNRVPINLEGSPSTLMPLADDDVARPNSAEKFIQSDPDTAPLRAGGSSYSDAQGVFTFLYPSDYTIDHQEGDKYTRVFKRATTQRSQSEISDGVMVVFERVELGDKSLSEWVDAQTQAKKMVTLNGYEGYTYSLQNPSETTYVVVSKDLQSDYAVKINILVADPNQQNYQLEVDAILSTLELRK
jgi:hypothetical protein